MTGEYLLVRIANKTRPDRGTENEDFSSTTRYLDSTNNILFFHILIKPGIHTVRGSNPNLFTKFDVGRLFSQALVTCLSKAALKLQRSEA